MESQATPTASIPEYIAELDRLDSGDNFRAFRAWCREYPTLQAAWDACPEPYWMLWLLMRAMWLKGDAFGKPEHRKLVGLMCKIMRAVSTLDDKRMTALIGNCERYASGESVARGVIRGGRTLIAVAATADTHDVASAYAASVTTHNDKHRRFTNQIVSMIREAYPTGPEV